MSGNSKYTGITRGTRPPQSAPGDALLGPLEFFDRPKRPAHRTLFQRPKHSCPATSLFSGAEFLIWCRGLMRSVFAAFDYLLSLGATWIRMMLVRGI